MSHPYYGNQSSYGANQNYYGANQNYYGANQNYYGANQNYYGANQNYYGGSQNYYGQQQRELTEGEQKYQLREHKKYVTQTQEFIDLAKIYLGLAVLIVVIEFIRFPYKGMVTTVVLVPSLLMLALKIHRLNPQEHEEEGCIFFCGKTEMVKAVRIWTFINMGVTGLWIAVGGVLIFIKVWHFGQIAGCTYTNRYKCKDCFDWEDGTISLWDTKLWYDHMDKLSCVYGQGPYVDEVVPYYMSDCFNNLTDWGSYLGEEQDPPQYLCEYRESLSFYNKPALRHDEWNYKDEEPRQSGYNYLIKYKNSPTYFNADSGMWIKPVVFWQECSDDGESKDRHGKTCPELCDCLGGTQITPDRSREKQACYNTLGFMVCGALYIAFLFKTYQKSQKLDEMWAKVDKAFQKKVVGNSVVGRSSTAAGGNTAGGNTAAGGNQNQWGNQYQNHSYESPDALPLEDLDLQHQEEALAQFSREHAARQDAARSGGGQSPSGGNAAPYSGGGNGVTTSGVTTGRPIAGGGAVGGGGGAVNNTPQVGGRPVNNNTPQVGGRPVNNTPQVGGGGGITPQVGGRPVNNDTPQVGGRPVNNNTPQVGGNTPQVGGNRPGGGPTHNRHTVAGTTAITGAHTAPVATTTLAAQRMPSREGAALEVAASEVPDTPNSFSPEVVDETLATSPHDETRRPNVTNVPASQQQAFSASRRDNTAMIQMETSDSLAAQLERQNNQRGGLYGVLLDDLDQLRATPSKQAERLVEWLAFSGENVSCEQLVELLNKLPVHMREGCLVSMSSDPINDVQNLREAIIKILELNPYLDQDKVKQVLGDMKRDSVEVVIS